MTVPPPDRTLGLIGLGLLGSALTEQLVAARFDVVGFDLDQERVEQLRRTGGTGVAACADIAERCRRILLSLPSHREVRTVVAELSRRIREGTIIVDTTTGAPECAEELARELALRGVSYVDATISGSSAQVRSGEAVLMVGGEAGAVHACADIFACIARHSFHTGAPGTGSKMKLVTNLVLGLNRAALAEGLALAASLNLDLSQTLAVMRGSPAYSRAMDVKGERMIQGNFAPEARLSQHLKDVRLIVELGQQAGLPMPFSAAHRGVLEAAEAAGCGELDNSAIIRVLGASGINGGQA